MSRADILQQICRRRRERVAAEGPTLGVAVPPQRGTPIVPFARAPAVICEIKRRSPSRGDIRADVNPVAAAVAYQQSGVRSVSVLTEHDHFGGSLADLMAVKQAAPQLALLRKDFLLTREDIDVAYRAGADAVLLIVAALEDAELAALHEAAVELGMQALVEVHSRDELQRAARLAPPLVGINSRDLRSFSIDRLLPLQLKADIDWPCRVIFESGILDYQDAFYATAAGFAGVLVGEAAMLNRQLPEQLVAAVRDGSAAAAGNGFWQRIALHRQRADGGGSGAGGSRGRAPRPLVKICGITNRADAVAAVRAGANILGFVYAESPRRAADQLPAELADLDVLKVAVVVCGGNPPRLPPPVSRLLAGGHIDALQFHGDEQPEQCVQLAAGAPPGSAVPPAPGVPAAYYKALRLRSAADAARIEDYRSPRVLIDAFDPAVRGGSGRRIAPELVVAAAQRLPLWLAGGIGVDNVAQIIGEWRPELIDVSSRLESRPGRKDHARLRAFFQQIDKETGNAAAL